MLLLRLVLLLCLLGVLDAPSSSAQQAESPFQTLTLHAGGTVNVNRGQLHSFWQPGYGAVVGFDTPFYWGRLDVGGALHHYGNKSRQVPSFDALLLYAGWGRAVHPLPWLSGFGSMRLGNYLMRFDDDTPGLRRENELTASLHGRLSLRVHGPWSLFAAGTYQKTFTVRRIHLWYLSAGLHRTLQTPTWLKELLQ